MQEPVPPPTPPAAESRADMVRRIADLARLDVTDEEVRELGEQFERILAHFAVLAQLDAGGQGEEGIVAAAGASLPESVLRDDAARPSFEPERLLSNAPARAGDFYRVPKTVGGEE